MTCGGPMQQASAMADDALAEITRSDPTLEEEGDRIGKLVAPADQIQGMRIIVDAESERKRAAAEEETKTTTDPPTLIAGEDSVSIQARESRSTMSCDSPLQQTSGMADDASAQIPRSDLSLEADRGPCRQARRDSRETLNRV